MRQHSPDLQAAAEGLLNQFEDVFSDTLSPTTHTTGDEMVIELVKDKPIKPREARQHGLSHSTFRLMRTL